MRAPVDLLQAAEELSARIPPTEAYALERNISWLAVGRGWLKLDDISGALRALKRLDRSRAETQLRVAIIQWAGEHPESEPARACVGDSVERIGVLEEHLSRRDLTYLVPVVFHLLGEQAVRRLAAELQDPFGASNVLVALADLQLDPEGKRQTREQAEQIADFEGGNRDFAMEGVYNGYLRGGWEEEAQRIRRGMDVKPGYVDEVLQEANKVMALAEGVLPPPGTLKPPDSPFARLRRFMGYRCNDLKVQFLVDMANAGGLDDPALESLITGSDFARIEPPRPPSIDQDPSNFDSEAFERFFFNRPVCLHDSDTKLLEAQDRGQGDPDRVSLLDRVATLFERFGDTGRRFSQEQIEQGLWYIIGNPILLGVILCSKDVPLEARQKTIRAMIYPFSQYCAVVGETFQGAAFFMWWDQLLGRPDEGENADIEPAIFEVIEQTLKLDSKACQSAALHGLNHLRPSRRASELVSRYLAEHRSAMDEKDIAWVEACRDGKAL